MKRNEKDLVALLKPKRDKLPSFDVVRKVLMGIDFKNFSKLFHDWAMQYVNIEKDEWISIDGKAIGGTVTNSSNIDQDFTSLISLYCSKQKQVLGNAQINNGKESEIPAVQQLIKALDLKGVNFTLDALHCQKKQRK